MKVLLVNGSPRKAGCTYTALKEVAGALEKSGIETEIFQIGSGPVWGCTGCHSCRETGHCIYTEDPANALIDKIREADGLVLGSPVYYAGPNGAFCALLDRAFYAASGGFNEKPGAAVASCRRAGATATLDRLNKYFALARMPVVSSRYWPMVHGNTPQQVLEDEEGLQIMRILGANMAWMLKATEGTPPPEKEEPVIYTNFVRQ